MRLYVLGTKAVLKESGGKWFPSSAVGWTDNPTARPKAVVTRNEAFTSAVKGCLAESKYKGGTVWGISPFNKCIGDKLS